MTSSIVAIDLPWPEAPLGHVFTEADWTNPERPDITTYVVSKTLAERAAWDFVKSEPGAPELAVVNPAFVLGPAPDPDLSTSHEVLRLMAIGAYPAAPKVGFPISDVRDVAITHALAHDAIRRRRASAFSRPTASCASIEIGRLLAEALPDLKSKVPKFEMHDFVGARRSPSSINASRPCCPTSDIPRPISNAKAHERAGAVVPLAQEAVKSAAASLRALHVI